MASDAKPELDSDGYPTEATLQRIRDWPPTNDWSPMLGYVMAAWWYYPDFATISEQDDEVRTGGRVLRWRFATGGWSGNEDLIRAIQDNTVAWMMTWYSSQRGGLHIFETPVRDDDGE